MTYGPNPKPNRPYTERMMAEETPTMPENQPNEPVAEAPAAANDAGSAGPAAEPDAALKAEVACEPASECGKRVAALQARQAAISEQVVKGYEQELADIRSKPIPTRVIRVCRQAGAGGLAPRRGIFLRHLPPRRGEDVGGRRTTGAAADDQHIEAGEVGVAEDARSRRRKAHVGTSKQ